MRTTRILIVALAAGLLAAGCGPSLLKPRGRVVKNGAPLIPAEGEFVRVTFVPVTGGDRPAPDFYVAEFNRADGTFQAAGKDRRGLPPGKYRVAVEHERRRKDLFNGAFNADRSPFVFDVDGSTPEIVIDLDKAR
jgi:hypothetical protein